MQIINCPHCTSENTISYEMAHKTASKSLIAEQTAPPQEPQISLGEFLGLVIATNGIISMAVKFLMEFLPKSQSYGVGFLLFFIIPAIYIFFRRKHIKQKLEVWNYEMEMWHKTWICFKCGNNWFLKSH